TVLSAEKNFQLENVDVGSGDHLSILTKQLRCESIETTTDLRDFSDQTVGSSVLISGPIATLWNGIDQPYTFHFVITRRAPYHSSLAPGASTTFLSEGTCFFYTKYNLPYT
ncbi:hypothetical protein PFISCL1PPCAC_28699, partial [Pristionchus fissidentatus]